MSSFEKMLYRFLKTPRNVELLRERVKLKSGLENSKCHVELCNVQFFLKYTKFGELDFSV